MKSQIAVFIIFAAGILQAKQQIDFINLQEGESINLTFESRGCFHHFIQTIVFTKRKVVNATLFKTDPVNSTPQLTKYVPVETLSLDETDLKKLNSLLRFYRTNKDSGCTTSDYICVKLLRDDQVILNEQYKDESGATYSRKDLLSIPTLLRRFSSTRL
jgi:hypothetical protein